MARKRNTNFFQKKSAFIVCCLIVAIIFLIAKLGGFLSMDYGVYDLLLHTAPNPTISEEVLFLDIDDGSLDQIGTWPWSRDVIADAMLKVKELGAYSVTFDIEYLSQSQKGLNPDIAEEIPQIFSESQNTVVSAMEQLGAAAASGQVLPEFFPDITTDVLQTNILPAFDNLYNSVNSISRDNDDYFGRTLQFMGNAWLTVNYSNIITTTEEAKKYVEERFLKDNVTDYNNTIGKTNDITVRNQAIEEGFSPALQILLERSAGAGFTNVIVDTGGSRRRMELLYEKDGKYLPQLVFGPLLKRVDAQGIEVLEKKLIIKDALFPNETQRKDVTIPLDNEGYMLINWFHGEYEEGFCHIPIIRIINMDTVESNIVACINWLYQDCYLLAEDGSWLNYYIQAQSLASEYQKITREKNSLLAKCNGYDSNGKPINGEITPEEYQNYFATRQTFFENCKVLIKGDSLEQINSRLEELYEQGMDLAEIQAFNNAVTETFSILEENLEYYTSEFQALKQEFDGAFCIVGNSATSTTDMGTTPFDPRYPNVGTHGNVYNTIITQQFITPLDWYIPFFISAFFSLVLAWFAMKANLKALIPIGIVFIIAIPLSAIVLMHFKLIYIPISAAFFTFLLSYLTDMVFRFVYSEHDKRFLRNAFSTYLSKDVVDDIVSNPEKLVLGGVEKNITALFSDIKNFSTFSEKLSATQLVSILNRYLTTMSDLILEENGTIDKYIGDAIVSFFGAPTDLEDHAYRACAAAVRMKQAEDYFNRQQEEQGILSSEIRTRIGINTGKMVVGNMGTDSKMNYTIMGNQVNIASRLEGVNKAYNSWILVSESTFQEANKGIHNGKLVFRRLDKVRVMGINEPIQLYNLMGFADEMSQNEIKSVDLFHQALDKYLEKRFEEAEKLFLHAASLNPNDQTPKVFIDRCTKFQMEAPPKDWNGVMTMLTK